MTHLQEQRILGNCSQEDPSMNVTSQNFSPEYLQELYRKTSGHHRKTNLTDQFFSPGNILFILDQIRLVLKELTGENVIVSFNDEMVHTMWQVASDNVGGLTYVPGSVALLNRIVIETEAKVLYSSLIRRKLWIKYYLKQDRMRVFPRGELTRGTKGDEVVSTSTYMLSNPSYARFRDCYLYATEGLKPQSSCQPSDGEVVTISAPEGKKYEKICGVLQPKKKKRWLAA